MQKQEEEEKKEVLAKLIQKKALDEEKELVQPKRFSPRVMLPVIPLKAA